MTLFVEAQGQGESIVLLHGWGFHSAVWKNITDVLQLTHRVTVVDLPGFGRSADVVSDYQFDTLIDLIVEVVPQNSILLGWSMGGLIAQGIAIKYPRHLKKLILLGCNAQFMATDEWPDAMKSNVLDSFIESLVNDYKKTLQTFLMLQAQGGKNAKETIRELKKLLFVHGEPSEAALRGGLLLLKSVSTVSQLEKIQLPVYLLFGRLDMLVPVNAGQRMAEKIPNATLHVFEHSAHAPFISHQEEFIDVLKEYIN